MLIAVVDDGIDWKQYPELDVKYDMVVTEDGLVRSRLRHEHICSNHGTTCARIIHKYASEASFCSLAIFATENLRANIKQLIAALEWCYEQKIPLVHLSVGSTRPSDYEPLQKVVYRMLLQGQTIVAAQSNKNDRYTMPACFSGVFGVKADPELTDNSFRVVLPAPVDGVRLAASSRHKLVNASGNFEETVVANSYSAPTITARVHDLLRKAQESVSFSKLWEQLTGQERITTAALRPDFISEALTFDPSGKLRKNDPIYRTHNVYFSLDTFWDALEKSPCVPALVIPPLFTSDVSSGKAY